VTFSRSPARVLLARNENGRNIDSGRPVLKITQNEVSIYLAMVVLPPEWGNVVASGLVRVLIVDDFEPFRQILRSALQDSTDVCEVADGLQSLEHTAMLQPDLILLDIGLPGLNGIEVARRIRDFAPECKIVFVSQESSIPVVQAALDTGAMGYVVKSDVADELLTAIDTVLQGNQFVSKTISTKFPGGSF
jgi:CheY-like chemotaxis protein